MMAKKQERTGTQTHAVSLITLIDPSSPISEQYRTIRTNIQFASSADKQIKTIVITSSGPGEGIRTTGLVSRCRYAEAYSIQDIQLK